ncbi:putative glycoside hydrolase family 39 protein [Emericellopsis cladophorae]|uniref:Glycoside hydrolase family 39 protein n=1 Tax=Emericellopsis cladophorae TaxID=2686198 RepID=A0A9Q0BI69_9HYPO|nr:putative glycoside hydrolase family 39 protein [Emericellopsis cladophorae]KAI6785525.1 putative glycoside hydrolase family 39 protein [Emericellopsis cladophorae]
MTSEVYATRDDGKPKVLASVRPNAATGRYDLTLTGLDALGVQGDSVQVKTLRFKGPDVNTAAYAFEL